MAEFVATNHCPDELRLSAYHDGELPPADRTAVERHLGECPPCVGYLDGLARVSAWVVAGGRGGGRADAAGPGPAAPAGGRGFGTRVGPVRLGVERRGGGRAAGRVGVADVGGAPGRPGDDGDGRHAPAVGRGPGGGRGRPGVGVGRAGHAGRGVVLGRRHAAAGLIAREPFACAAAGSSSRSPPSSCSARAWSSAGCRGNSGPPVPDCPAGTADPAGRAAGGSVTRWI